MEEPRQGRERGRPRPSQPLRRMPSQGLKASSGASVLQESASENPRARRSRGIGHPLLVKLCALFVVFQIGMTVLYLAPTPGPIRRIATAYMEPVFKQSWWVFAPDPVSSNVYLSVQAKKSDGTETPWFNITKCDIKSAILHHPVPDRRYLAAFQLMRHYELGRDNLPKDAQSVLLADAGSDWKTSVPAKLKSQGASAYEINDFMKSNEAANNLASLIAQARWGEVQDVHVRMTRTYTRPFPQRNTNVPLRTVQWSAGYLPVAPGTSDERQAVSGLYGPGSGC